MKLLTEKFEQNTITAIILTNKFRCIWWWAIIIWQKQKYL